jgi:hypothetical protein
MGNRTYTTPFTTVAIAQGAAGTTELAAAQSGKIIRLHEILGFMSAAGSWQLKSASTAITGVMPALASIEIGIPWRRDSDGCYKTASGEALNLVTVTGAFTGVAKYSVEDA